MNIENYQINKTIEKENMEEIDIINSLKKLDKTAEFFFFGHTLLNLLTHSYLLKNKINESLIMHS